MYRTIKEKGVQGYFTVEATFIMSFVLICIVLVIYTAFFLYDRCLYSQDAYILCFRESLIKDDRDKASELSGKAESQFGRKYFAVSGRSLLAEDSNGKITCEGTAGTAHSLFQGASVMPSLDWSIHFSSSSRHTDPASHIRIYRRLRYIASGAAELLKK